MAQLNVEKVDLVTQVISKKIKQIFKNMKKSKTNKPASKIIFFEWSDPKRSPIVFESTESFKSFCADSNIKIGNRQINFIDASTANGDCYASCKVGKAELVMSKNYDQLRKNISWHKHKSAI